MNRDEHQDALRKALNEAKRIVRSKSYRDPADRAVMLDIEHKLMAAGRDLTIGAPRTSEAAFEGLGWELVARGNTDRWQPVDHIGGKSNEVETRPDGRWVWWYRRGTAWEMVASGTSFRSLRRVIMG